MKLICKIEVKWRSRDDRRSGRVRPACAVLGEGGDGAGQPARVTAAGAGGGDNRRLATAGPARPTDGEARAEETPAERKVGLWMSSVGGRRQRRRQVLTWSRRRRERSDHAELETNDGEQDSSRRSTAMAAAGTDLGANDDWIGATRRARNGDDQIDLFFFIGETGKGADDWERKPPREVGRQNQAWRKREPPCTERARTLVWLGQLWNKLFHT